MTKPSTTRPLDKGWAAARKDRRATGWNAAVQTSAHEKTLPCALQPSVMRTTKRRDAHGSLSHRHTASRTFRVSVQARRFSCAAKVAEGSKNYNKFGKAGLTSIPYFIVIFAAPDVSSNLPLCDLCDLCG